MHHGQFKYVSSFEFNVNYFKSFWSVKRQVTSSFQYILALHDSRSFYLWGWSETSPIFSSDWLWMMRHSWWVHFEENPKLFFLSSRKGKLKEVGWFPAAWFYVVFAIKPVCMVLLVILSSSTLSLIATIKTTDVKWWRMLFRLYYS